VVADGQPVVASSGHVTAFALVMPHGMACGRHLPAGAPLVLLLIPIRGFVRLLSIP
jgi:hypothetical protein